MPASTRQKILSVRLPEADLRRFKSIAATRGISVQSAVQQAMDAWAMDTTEPLTQALDALQGSLADVDVFRLLREEKIAEQDKDRKRIGA